LEKILYEKQKEKNDNNQEVNGLPRIAGTKLQL
jgi:hypothetical protein